MSDKKTQRIQRETRDMVSTRAREIAELIESKQRLGEPSDFYPLKEDICWIPEVRTTITEGSVKEFDALKIELADRLPLMIAEFKEARLAALLPLLPYENPSVEKLSLATTWFQCERNWCQALRHSGALVHSCFKRPYSDASESDRYYMDLVGRPWALSQGTLFFEKKAERARELILAVGGDPETMTHEEMDEQGHRFIKRHDLTASFESFYSMVRHFCLFWVCGRSFLTTGATDSSARRFQRNHQLEGVETRGNARIHAKVRESNPAELELQALLEVELFKSLRIEG